MSDSFLLDLRRRRLTNETTTDLSCNRIQQMSDQQHALGIDPLGHFQSVNPDDPLGGICCLYYDLLCLFHSVYIIVWRFMTVEGDEHPYMICTENKDYYWNWNGGKSIMHHGMSNNTMMFT